MMEGKAGVTERKGAPYSTWFNGGLRTTAHFHNMIGILTETIGSPTPISIPFVAEQADRRLESVLADRAADGVAHAAVDRVLDHGQPRDSRLRVALSREGALRHLPDGHATRFSGAARTTGRSRRTRWRACRTAWSRSGVATPAGDSRRGVDVRGRRSRRAWRRRRPRRRRRRPRSALRGADVEGAARSARLHHSVRPAGLRHGDEVREHADQDRHHRHARDGAVHGRRQDLSGELVRREDRAGVPAARDGHVRAAGSSRRHSVSRRAADAAVRRDGLHARVSDGRAVRSHPRRVRRAVRRRSRPTSRSVPAGAVEDRRSRAARSGYYFTHQANDSFIVVNRLLAAGEDVVVAGERPDGRAARSTWRPSRRRWPILQKAAASSASAFDAAATAPTGSDVAAQEAAHRPLRSRTAAATCRRAGRG